MQGQLKLYPVDIPDIIEHPPEKRVIKSTENILYRFAHVSSLLINNTSETKKFKHVDQAKEFLSALNPDNEQLITIANELDIKIPNTASVNPTETSEVISEALVTGNVVVIVDKTSTVPIKRKEWLNKSDNCCPVNF